MYFVLLDVAPSVPIRSRWCVPKVCMDQKGDENSQFPIWRADSVGNKRKQIKPKGKGNSHRSSKIRALERPQ